MTEPRRRVVVVTGGAHGIGLACARRFAHGGDRLVLIDRDPEVEQSARSLEQAGGDRSLAIVADLTKYSEVVAAFERIKAEAGAVDVLVNNVGQAPRDRFQPFFSSEPELWDFIIDVSLKTTIACSRQVVADMRARRRGRIVSVSSEAAFTGGAGSVEYAAAKAGVIGYTRALARIMAPFDVTVNAISPGAVRTRAADMWKPEVREQAIAGIPVGRLAEPEEIAASIHFLASDDASYITGQTLLVNGGRYMH